MNVVKNFRMFEIVLIIFILGTISIYFVENVNAEESSEVLRLVNNERAIHSLKPLKMDKNLENAAKIRNNEIKIFFSHTRPNGSPFYSVSSKVKCENLAAGQKTPEEVVSAWMKSPPHKKNILNPNVNVIGISYKKTNKGYKHYWVQLFGNVKAKQSNIKKICGMKVECKKNNISLKWNKQIQATGYEIHVSTPKIKNYKLLKQITKSNTNSLIISKLKSSTSYKFKIRSYKVICGKTYFAPFLKITAKTKGK